MVDKMDFLKDLWLFMKERKKFWLAPIIIVLFLLSVLIIFGGSSAVTPFIYTIFWPIIMEKHKTNPAKTVLTISVGFIVVYLITKWNWAILAALIIALIGFFSIRLSKVIDFLWMKFTWLLSLIVLNVLLSAVFFLFLFPIAVLSRLFGNGDPLNLKNKAESVFIDSNKKFDKSSFEKPW